ncbi:hypothetical protein GRC12_09515 [Streptomyces griseorubiginosus]|nr:hypothetical protein [Streptomyces griseorubiginosus]
MYVNKRREPTTDTQVTRRAVRRVNFRAGDETWRVVRPLGEIASLFARSVTGTHPPDAHGLLAEIFRFSGIFGAGRSSFLTGNGDGIGHMSRIPHPGGVKQRKPGNHRGAVPSGTDERSAGGGE